MRLRPAGRAEWLEVAAASPAATFFHTPYWADVAGADGRWVDATALAVLGDGARAVYPLLAAPRRRLRRLARAESTYAGCYGGPIAERPLRPEEIGALHAAAARRHLPGLRVTLGPGMAGAPAPRGFVRATDHTSVVALGDGFDAALTRFDRKQRAAYRRGAEAGLAARPAAGTSDHDAYRSMYASTLERRGERSTAAYPAAVLRALARIVDEVPDVGHLWLVEHEGIPAAGVYGFRWGEHMVLWHAASSDLRLPIASPMVTLLAEMMRWAAASGVRTFDMNPSGGLEGVAAFKRRLGAVELPVQRLRREHAAARAALSAVNRLDALRRRA